MPSGDLLARVEVLEKRMTALEELPARVSALEMQVLQLRTEMRDEFSAVRQEMRALNESTRDEMRALGEKLRGEMRSLEEGLRAEMRALNDHTLTQVRVLHEEVIDRIARLDGNGGARRSNGRRKRR